MTMQQLVLERGVPSDQPGAEKNHERDRQVSAKWVNRNVSAVTALQTKLGFSGTEDL
jgi:hypothetical protein